MIPFTRLGIDEAMEHLHKNTKEKGGITDIASYAETLFKLFLIAPALAHIGAKREDLLAAFSDTTKPGHSISSTEIASQEQGITKLHNLYGKFVMQMGKSKLIIAKFRPV